MKNVTTLNSRGFSLIEILIAAGLSAIIAFVMSTMFIDSQKNVKNIEARSDLVQLSNELRYYLSDITRCNNAFIVPNDHFEITMTDANVNDKVLSKFVSPYDQTLTVINADDKIANTSLIFKSYKLTNFYSLGTVPCGTDTCTKYRANLMLNTQSTQGFAFKNVTIPLNLTIKPDLKADSCKTDLPSNADGLEVPDQCYTIVATEGNYKASQPSSRHHFVYKNGNVSRTSEDGLFVDPANVAIKVGGCCQTGNEIRYQYYVRSPGVGMTSNSLFGLACNANNGFTIKGCAHMALGEGDNDFFMTADGCYADPADAERYYNSVTINCCKDPFYPIPPTPIDYTPPDPGWGEGELPEDPCFVAGTKITMANGQKINIEDVRVGDYVQTYNDQSGLMESKQVLEKMEHPENLVTLLDFYLADGSSFTATDNHPIYITEYDEYLRASDVESFLNSAGRVMHLLRNDGQKIQIDKIVSRVDRVPVYNLDVDGEYVDGKSLRGASHNYFAEGFLVHNGMEILIAPYFGHAISAKP